MSKPFNLYHSLTEARDEIIKRQNDLALKQKVKDFLKNDIPTFLEAEPAVVLLKTLITANNELTLFLDIAKNIDLPIRLLEHNHDKFVAINKDKYYLGKLYFHFGMAKNGIENLQAIKAINFDVAENEFVDGLETLWGEKLKDFHHNVLFDVHPELSGRVYDFSDWLLRNGQTAKEYYEKFFALFVAHGILCDNFLDYDFDAKLTKKVIIPAFKKTVKRFGVAPLIVPLEPFGTERHIFWSAYPKELKKYIDSYISNHSDHPDHSNQKVKNVDIERKMAR